MDRKLNILIIDDEPMIGKTFKDILIIKGYEADIAHSGEEALQKLEGKKIDCILSDIKMPGMNGLELFVEIRNRGYSIPTILMTAYSTENIKKAALIEGVIAVLSKPLDINMLLSFFPCLKKERVIAIVDDDSNFCNVIGKILEMRGFRVIEFTDPDKIIDDLDRDIGILLLDMKLKGTDGLEILKKIRKKNSDLTVILITGYREEMAEKIQSAMEINAYSCFYKPFQVDELLRVIGAAATLP